MSGPKVASKTAGGGSAIPAGDRKLIAFVKEVATSHSDEEIYAMLKECNKNPDEAAQRLLNEDNFHVVKRKKDKKKEAGTNKDAADSRQGNSGSLSRGGKSYGTSGGRGPGRGTSSVRSNSNAEGNGGRSRTVTVKENGIPSHVKTSSATVGGSLSYSQLVQPKASFNNNLNNGIQSSNGDLLQATVSPSLEGAWPANSGFGTSTALQGAWLAGSGLGTIADMLKGGARKSSPLMSGSTTGDVVLSAVPAVNTLEQLSVSNMNLPALDPVASAPLDSHVRSPGSAVQREARFSNEVSTFGFQDEDVTQYVQANNGNTFSAERDIPSLQPTDLNISVPLEEQVQGANDFLGGESGSVGIADMQEGQTGGPVSQFNGASGYHLQQQYVESQKDNANLDWGSRSLPREEDPPKEVLSESTVLDGQPPSAANLQDMSVRDNHHSVIIPDHIRVSEADCPMLSFGSFDVGFDGMPSNPNFIQEETGGSFESTDVNDLSAAMRALSASAPTSAMPDHEQAVASASGQSLHTSTDNNATEEEEGSKDEEDLSEPPSQLEYPPSYSGMSAVTSDHTGHYTSASEETESRPRDVSAALPPYDSSTYYSGMFRSVPEIDSRYSAFSQLAASGKLGTSRPAETTGQSASQEVMNASIYPSSNAVGGQTLPAVNNGPSAMSLPQHSIHPYAAQPSGLPLGHFANVLGYHQYMPPGFSYMQSPYQQHNYVGAGNYHQVPAAVGAGAMKYPVPQYKTGGPAAGGMHNTLSPSSLGYGGYPNTQPASNLPASSGNTSNFEDAAPQHFKESNMYMPSQQQIDGPSVWLQTQLARETQGSSYYNVSGQNQPTRYSQTQSLLTHTHPGTVYGNLYHPQQSGSSPSAHQLLQQQQVLGSMGALGSQIGSYQQNQRAQPTWAPGPY